MKLKNHSTVNFWLLLTAVFLFALRMAAVQPVLMNPQPTSVEPVAQREAAPGAMDVFLPAYTTAQPNLPEIFQYGWLNVHPHVAYSLIYGDGIQSAPTNSQKTIIQTLSPGVLFDLGRHWAFDYTPTIRFYSSDKFRDGVDHSLSLNGGTIYNDWKFGLSQTFLYTTAPTAETGTQTEQQTFATALSASRILNDSMSMDFGVNQNILSADQFQSSRTWSTLEWLNYQFWPRLNAGIGAGGGYVSVDTGPNQIFEELEARINWRATDKLSFSINAGGEDRQFESTSSGTNSTAAPDLITPVFGASIEYAPFRDTEISLNGSRSVAPSLFQDAITETTTVSANLNQKLLKKFQLNVGVGYTKTDYSSTVKVSTATGSRTDNYYSFNARLSHPFAKRGTWDISYQYNDSQSTAPGLSFQGSQIGFDISYSY